MTIRIRKDMQEDGTLFKIKRFETLILHERYDWRNRKLASSTDALVLLFVCRQLYADTNLLLYSCPELVFEMVGRGRSDGLREWLAERSLLQKSAINNVSINIGKWNIYDCDKYLRHSPGLVRELPALKRLCYAIQAKVAKPRELAHKILLKEAKDGVWVGFTCSVKY